MSAVGRAAAERMAVIVPTRERPREVMRLIGAWLTTKASACLVLGVDEDDDSYDLAAIGAMAREHSLDIRVLSRPRTHMAGLLNALAVELADEFAFLGFMGDDHLPRTHLWDQVIALHLGDLSIAYGDDLIQGEELPTAVFMDARIVRTLGYMAPPGLTHLYLDDTWLTWGKALGTLRYLPYVVIEHMHPIAGKANWDEGHNRVNSDEQWARDGLAYAQYRAEKLPSDLARLRAL